MQKHDKNRKNSTVFLLKLKLDMSDYSFIITLTHRQHFPLTMFIYNFFLYIKLSESNYDKYTFIHPNSVTYHCIKLLKYH